MTIIQTDKPLQKRRAFDHYPTPPEVCKRGLDLLPLEQLRDFYGFYSPPLHILDPGCGDGVWGRTALERWPDAIVDGAEIRDISKPEGYRWMYRGDFCLMDHGLDYDLIIGNPPFLYGEIFVRQALANLVEAGWLLYLLPLRFLEGKERSERLFSKYPPLAVHVAGRVSFSGNRKTDDTPYAYYIWRKGYTGDTILKWALAPKVRGTK